MQDELTSIQAQSADPYAGDSRGHRPSGDKWQFDAPVAAVFEDMLRRSIPDYETMRALTVSVARRFVTPGGYIVDLGCSDGLALHSFARQYGVGNRYVGVEVSEPMLRKAQERLAPYGDMVRLEPTDLRHGYPDPCSCVTLAVLTLQFIPLEHRQRVVQRVYDRLEPGGAFVLVEKVLGSTALFQSVFVDEYHEGKHRNGYSWEDIERKRLSLEGVLMPLTAEWNVQMIKDAGFREVDCFWRHLNFAGWIGVK